MEVEIPFSARHIDQHTLTGESQPVEKETGDRVFAGTLVLTGRVSIQVESTGKETITIKIGEILQQTSNYKDTLLRVVNNSLIVLYRHFTRQQCYITLENWRV